MKKNKSNSSKGWTLRVCKLDELIPWTKNPRTITKKQALQLEESIRKFGLCEPLVANKDGTLIGGHQRLATLQRLNYTEACVYFSNTQLSQKEKKELALRLNKNHGDWDYDLLANEFDIEELLALGWEEEELGLFDIPEEEPQKKTSCKITITFQNVDDLQEAENKIGAIVDTYPGAFYKVKIN